MKVQIEDYLQNIDLALKDKPQKEKYMIYILIFSVLFAISYLFFWDPSLQSFEQKLSQTKKVESAIAKDKAFLNTKPELQISNIEKQIKDIQLQLTKYKDYNNYIKSKIEEISFLLYDERVWGEYLNSISKKAKRFNIKVRHLSNKYNLASQDFGHVLDIDLIVSGNYKNMLKFINSLEESELVVNIHSLDIKAKDYLEANLKISIWGIIY